MKRFDSTGGVVVLDPRKGYIAPEIYPWLAGLTNVADGKWLVGDMSFPLGGTAKNYDQATTFKGTNRNIRFNHKSHRHGSDIDINLPLKGGKTNKWNENITDSNLLDEEKIISLLKYYKSSPSYKLAGLNPKHVFHLRKYANKKYGKESEEYKAVGAGSPLQGWKNHWDHIHFRFEKTIGLESLAYARRRLATDEPIQVAAAEREGSTAIPAPKKRPSSTERRISYVLGDLESGGEVYGKRDENEYLTAGASMNKPIVALIQMLKYKDEPEKKLTKQELDGLLAYSGRYRDSNNINRIVARRRPRTHTKRGSKMSLPSGKRQKQIGKLTPEDAREYLAMFGLDPNTEIIYGGWAKNKQTSKQFFQFMRFLHDKEKLASLGIEKEAEIIKNYMKRDVAGLEFGKDRETRKMGDLKQKLNKAGVPVASLYGKGGWDNNQMHYSFVIDNKYVVSMYSNQGAAFKGSRDRFIDDLVHILRKNNIPAQPQVAMKESKLLSTLFRVFDAVDKEVVKNELV